MESMSRDSRHECPKAGCGGTLRHTGRKRELYGGHHVTVMVCGECGAEVERGPRRSWTTSGRNTGRRKPTSTWTRRLRSTTSRTTTS